MAMTGYTRPNVFRLFLSVYHSPFQSYALAYWLYISIAPSFSHTYGTLLFLSPFEICTNTHVHHGGAKSMYTGEGRRRERADAYYFELIVIVNDKSIKIAKKRERPRWHEICTEIIHGSLSLFYHRDKTYVKKREIVT